MGTPVGELPPPLASPNNLTSRSSEDNTFIRGNSFEDDENHLTLSNTNDSRYLQPQPSPSQAREQEHRLDDDLALLQAERVVSNANAQNARNEQSGTNLARSATIQRSRSRRSGPLDEFDIATNPIHEKTAMYKPPEHPTSNFAKVFKKVHNSSFLIRYFTYITPVVVIILIPLLLGGLVFKEASVGGVSLLWFSIWLETVWLTLWAGRIVAKMIPWPLGLISSLFTNNSKKWRDMGKQLEVPAAIFFWFLGVEISFLPTMRNHRVNESDNQDWEGTVNRIIVSLLTGATLNFIEKIIIQLIAISFHLRTYADRIELNKFQIGSLTKLYRYSKEKISLEDSDFEEGGISGPGSGARTPMHYIDKAQKNVTEAFNKASDVAGKIAGDFTGKQVTQSTHPHQVVLMLLNSTPGSQVLARRLYRTFVRENTDTVYSDDIKNAFDNDEEAEAAFTMFDRDLNGDISMEELEAVCVEIGRERKSITASLKDLDSVVSKLDAVLFFIVICVTTLVFITLISASAANVLTSAGSTVLALSWLLSATAQEFLQSMIFVFVKHPFDVGDRVTIYGNTGSMMKGDDYFVKEISLLFTEFKKMEGHVVQAPNSYLNTLFILNMRRSGGLAEAVPLTIKFGTTLDQIDELRSRLLEFVKVEKREYQGNILTEIRDVVEAHSINLNVIFFYKSNWQNEGLRLQRRNKFICAMMVSMQEIGIEGPRMRLPGQKEDVPFYVRHPPDSNTSESSSYRPVPLARDPAFVPSVTGNNAVHQQPSILRHTAGTSRNSRPRGESVSAMSKRVDFSIGMRDISSGNMMGDVYDDNSKVRLPDLSRTLLSRSQSSRRVREERDESFDTSLDRTSPRDCENRSRFGLHRASTESRSRLRGGRSMIHGNRFFGKRGKEDLSDGADEDLMEQGMADIPESERMDPRSGIVSPRAVQIESESENHTASPRQEYDEGKPQFGVHREDFEMKRFDR